MRSGGRLRGRTTFACVAITTTIPILSFIADAAAQQSPAQPDRSVTLPPVTVETHRTTPRQRPVVRRAAVRPAARPPAVVEPPQTAPTAATPTEGILPSIESAVGPVQGYVATRSSTSTKTNTPLIETPRVSLGHHPRPDG